MRGAAVWMTAVAACAALLAGCARAAPVTGLPSFPPSAEGAADTATGAPTGNGLVPDDCAGVLAPPDLGAVLGLPLGSVGVRTTVGVAAPAVGRTERLDCAYTVAPGRPLLAVRAAAYADDASARAQWQLNADIEQGIRRDVPIGAASSVLVQRPDEALLTVVYGRGTLTITLPARPLPGGHVPGDVLVDLALRALPTMSRAAPSAAPTSASTSAVRTPAADSPPTTGSPSGPARAAGAVP